MDKQRLINEAKRYAARRGHNLSRWNHQIEFHSSMAVSCCTICGAYVGVDAKPSPNGIDIGGEAVAINCPGEPAPLTASLDVHARWIETGEFRAKGKRPGRDAKDKAMIARSEARRKL